MEGEAVRAHPSACLLSGLHRGSVDIVRAAGAGAATRSSSTAVGRATTAQGELYAATACLDRGPETEVEAYPLDVVADADQICPLLAPVNLVVCATDGVAPRRVVSHLARRARLDAILACVLEDGGLGEVLRLRPWKDRGCLVW